ncbi:TPA: hypothetical protein ACJQAW_001762 [Streptococcus pyogenes]
MLTSKHHNLNKLVWRYGLTSAAAVLLAFGGGASSVKAEISTATMTQQERAEKIKKIKDYITKYPKTTEERFWNRTWIRDYFKDEDYLKAVQSFTEQALENILELIEKGATKGEKGDAGPAGPRGERGPQGKAGEKGETGPRGERGEQGIQGEQGKAGEKGEKATKVIPVSAVKKVKPEQLAHKAHKVKLVKMELQAKRVKKVTAVKPELKVQ